MKELKNFYDEQKLILSKYSYIKTPLSIQKEINRLNMSCNITLPKNKEHFWKFSTRFKLVHKIEAQYQTLCMDSPTFDEIRYEHRAWYARWRGLVLENEIIDTDKSYIYLLAYELINYSFNSNAAFNLSMLEKLALTFEHNEIGDTLRKWLIDMLFELEAFGILETEGYFVFKRQQFEYLLYLINNNETDKLKISDWPSIDKLCNSEFMAQYKNDMELVFQKVIEGLNLKKYNNHFYTELNNASVLFEGALIVREIEKADKILLNENNELSKLFFDICKITENVVRSKYSLDLLNHPKIPELKQLQAKLINSYRDRFVVVQESVGIEGSEYLKIPEKKEMNSNENSDTSIVSSEEVNQNSEDKLSFDLNVISKNRKEMSSFIDSLGIDETENIIEFHNEDIKSNYLEILGESSKDIHDLTPFVEVLNQFELELINLFENGILEISILKGYCKEEGQLPSVALDKINEISVSLFDETIFEIKENQVEIYEEFLFITDLVKNKLEGSL